MCGCITCDIVKSKHFNIISSRHYLYQDQESLKNAFMNTGVRL